MDMHPAESHQELLTASAPQNPKETPKSSTQNGNNNSGKDHNNTSTTRYPHYELEEELSRTHTLVYPNLTSSECCMFLLLIY